MNVQHKKRKRRDGALSSLNAAIDAMNIAKDALSATPAKAVVGSVSVILTMIRVGSLTLLASPKLTQIGFHD